jgi:ABC-type transport system involved in multi-copper enzyme maturation permease subunit
LSDREIVLGKLLARVLHLGGVFLAAVPVLCLTLLWGGVSAPLLLAGCVVTAASLLSVGGVSVLCSVLCGTGRSALAWSYALVAAFCLLGLATPTPFLSSPVAFVVYLNRELAGCPRVGAATLAMMAASLANLYAMVHVTLASACVALAVRRLRAASRVVEVPIRLSAGDEEEQAARLLYGPDWASASGPPPVGDRPLLWKEMHQGGPRTAGPPPGRLLKDLAVPWLGLLFLIGVCTLAVRASVPGSAGEVDSAFNLLCRAAGVTQAAAWCVGVAFRAASAVSRDRERGTLDGLLTLPVGRGAILRAKWLGSILRYRSLGYALALLWSFGLAFGVIHPLALPLAALSCAGSLALLASLGLWLSLVARTTVRANVSMAVVLLLWFFGPWLAAPFVGPPVPRPECWPGYFDWFGCNPLGAWWVAHFSWADLTPATGPEAALLRARLAAVLTGFLIQTAAAGALWLLAWRRFRSTFGR